MSELLQLTPKFPDASEIDWKRATLRYDEESDTLLVSLYTPARPAVTFEYGGESAWRVDPTTQEVVGVMIEGFLKRFVFTHPDMLFIAEVAGVDPDRIEQIRREIDPEQQRQAAVGAMMERLFAHA